MPDNKVKIVILAAGKGVRMESVIPKPLVLIHGKPMIRHLLDSVESANIDDKPIIVVGNKKELIMQELGCTYEYAVQNEQLGTAHALLAARDKCGNVENVMVLFSDQPFITTETLKKLLQKHLNNNTVMTLTTALLPDYESWRKVFLTFGRVIRKDGKISDKEYKDATPEEREIKEVNVSCYVFKANWLWENLQKLDRNQNAQKEYYLTDLWQIASENNEKIESVQVDPMEALGVSSKEELEILEKLVV